MADKAISDLTPATSVGALDLFVLEQNNTAKKLQGSTLLTFLGALWESYGGITDTMQYYAVSDDDTTAPSTWYTTRQSMTNVNRFLWSYMTITYATGDTQSTTPCVIGVWGDQGDAWYVYLKYASSYPTSDDDMGDTPDEWVGVYSGISASAPTSYTAYTWYNWKGIQGDTGTSITSVSKTGSSGVQDIYTVQLSNGTSTTFTVTNGSNIQSIAKTSSSGLQDTYTVTLTDGNTTQFSVNNGKGITAVEWTSTTSPSGTPHIAGATDTYTISYNDGDTSQFQVYNGANGAGAVAKVDGIDAVGDDVPLLTIGNGAPTTATQGNTKSRYFDATNSVLYICLGYDSQSGTYTWQGAGVTVDSAMSTSSTNPVQNKIISAKVGTVALNTTAQDCSNAINEHENDIGNMSLDTSASNLTGAINELVTDLSGKAATDASNISSASAWLTALGTKASDYTIYNSVTDLGLTSGSATISGAFTAMSSNTILIANAAEFGQSDRPTQYAIIEIIKLSSTRAMIYCYGKEPAIDGDYRMGMNSSNVPTGIWRREYGKDLLWTNSDTTANFAAGDVALDLSIYDAVEINVKCGTSVDEYFSAVCYKNQATTLMGGNVGGTAYYYKRQATASGSKVTFGGGYRNTTAGNNYAIPYKIYGIRGIN